MWDQQRLFPVFLPKIRRDLTSQELQFHSLFVRLQAPRENCTAAVLNTVLLTVTSLPGQVRLCHRINMAEELVCCLQTKLLTSATLPTCAYSIGVSFCFSYSTPPVLENQIAIAAVMLSSGSRLRSAVERKHSLDQLIHLMEASQ